MWVIILDVIVSLTADVVTRLVYTMHIILAQ
jgi:hypothetical protein